MSWSCKLAFGPWWYGEGVIRATVVAGILGRRCDGVSIWRYFGCSSEQTPSP